MPALQPPFDDFRIWVGRDRSIIWTKSRAIANQSRCCRGVIRMLVSASSRS